MDKRTIKKNIRAAIVRDPLREDIARVSLFGSRARGKPAKQSDVDLLIEFSPGARIGFFKLARIKRGLERSIKHKVDLVTPEGLSKYFRADVLARAETIYEKQ